MLDIIVAVVHTSSELKYVHTFAYFPFTSLFLNHLNAGK